MIKVGKVLSKIPRIINNQRYLYISPVDKPIYPLCLNSLSQLSAEMMQYSFIQSGGSISPELSVFIGAIAFRMLTEGFCTIIRGFKFKGEPRNINYVERANANGLRPLLRWIDKVFIVDSVRDYQFYGFNTEKINKMIHLYLRPSTIIANLANFYLCLNFLRGANFILVNEHLQSFCLSTTFIPSLSVYDPYFMTPLLGIVSTYLMLRYSRHPFLVHLVYPPNAIHCFNIAFMVGLLLVPVPSIYHFAFSGLVTGHLGIRWARYFLRDGRDILGKLIK